MTLVTRLFHHGSSSSKSSGSSSNHTCPAQTINDPPQVPFVSNLSFQQFAEIFSGACLGICCLLTFFLIFRHATNYTVPREQKQIIRITLTLPIFSLISLLCILSPSSAIYILPLADLYEAFSFAAFFLLLCTYIRDAQAHSLTASASPVQTYKAALKIFQFPAVMLLVVVITEITEALGVYCDTQTKVYFAKLWCTILKALSTVVAIVTLLPFYKRTLPVIRSRSPTAKLLAFKGIVFLNFIQTLLFSFLTPHLSPTNKLTTLDLTVVIPRLVLSIEMVIFAAVFVKVYGVGEYLVAGGGRGIGKGEGGVLGWKAFAQAGNAVGFVGEMVREVRGRGGEGEEEMGELSVRGKYESVRLTNSREERV
ncbi:hypothetical protein ACMFMG_009635 [Clarireedia jacksonii]